MRKFVTTLTMAVLLTSPAFAWNPKEPINGFNRESLYRSIRALTQEMSDEEKRTFRRGFNALMVETFPLTFGMSPIEATPFLPMVMEAAHVTMDGVTLGTIMQRGGQGPVVGTQSGLATQSSPIPQPAGADKPVPNKHNPFDQIAERDRFADETEQREEAHLAAVRGCLAEKLPFTARYIHGKGIYGDLELSLTNDLSWPITYLGFNYTISVPSRPVALAEKEVARTLRGGLKPGETRKVKMTVSAIPLDIDPDQLVIDVSLLNVADMEGKSLLRKPKSLFVGGLSDKVCE